MTAAGLCTGPIPVHFCGAQPMAAICMHQLVNLPVLCNMHLNVLNDLAKAKRRWTEKKDLGAFFRPTPTPLSFRQVVHEVKTSGRNII